jgi:hypothetical protein
MTTPVAMLKHTDMSEAACGVCSIYISGNDYQRRGHREWKIVGTRVWVENV